MPEQVSPLKSGSAIGLALRIWVARGLNQIDQRGQYGHQGFGAGMSATLTRPGPECLRSAGQESRYEALSGGAEAKQNELQGVAYISVRAFLAFCGIQVSTVCCDAGRPRGSVGAFQTKSSYGSSRRRVSGRRVVCEDGPPFK